MKTVLELINEFMEKIQEASQNPDIQSDLTENGETHSINIVSILKQEENKYKVEAKGALLSSDIVAILQALKVEYQNIVLRCVKLLNNPELFLDENAQSLAGSVFSYLDITPEKIEDVKERSEKSSDKNDDDLTQSPFN